MSEITINKPCIRCEERRTIRMEKADFERWQMGEHIQDVAPYVSEGDRELLISGICGKCFDEIFENDDEEDEDEYAH